MSQDTRAKQKVRSVPEILKTNLVELNYFQTEIVIIDPKPHHSTHFYIPLRIHRWICLGKAKHRRILLNSIINSRDEK